MEVPVINHEEYGRALFLVAEESARLNETAEDAETALSILSAHPQYVKLMDSPAVPTTEKLALIDRAFGTLEHDLVSFLKILVERRSLYLFPRTLLTFRALADEHRGILPAEVVSAVPLSEGQKDALAQKLAKKTGKSIRLSNTVDPSVLGGLLIRYSGVQVDGTLSVRLERLGDTLANLIV